MNMKMLLQIFVALLLPLMSSAQNFVPVWTSPYNPMTIYAIGAELNGANLPSGNEIGIFDIDPNTSQQICVGAGTLVQPLTGGAYLEIIASMNDGSVPGHANGFTPGHTMIFKFYSQISGLVESITVAFPYPGYDEVFASQGNAFVSLSGTIQGLLTLTTSSNPPEGGTTSGSGNYQPGTLVTVSATANDCWSFVNWTENGSIVSTNPEFTFTVEDNRNLTANFAVLQYQVITSSNPAGGGTTSGNGTYDCGDEVTVTATSFSGYTFVNWTENGTEISNQASFTFLLESNRNLVANFQVEAFHFEPVWNSPYNPMTIYVLSAVIDFSNLQTGDDIGIFDIDPNTSQEICVGAGTLVQPLTGGAYLEIIASMNDGSVPGHANGFTPGHSMIFKFYSLLSGLVESVTVAFPYPGYDEVFASQGNAFVSLSGTIQGLLTVTTTSNPPEGGTTSGSGNYQPGTLVTVSATANNCWSFVNWTENGSIISTNPEFSFTVEDNRNLTANFTVLQYQVITSSNPTGGGTTSGNGTYNCGEEVTVSATSFSGYTFVNWTENGTEVSNQASFTFLLESNRNLVANFQVEITYFEPVWTSPYNPMTIYVLEALLDNVDLQPLSQIGVFDTDPNNGEEICVGAMILNSVISPGNYLEIITSMNDGTVPGHANGFTPGHPFIFKYMTNTGQLVEDVQFTFPYSGYNEVFTSQGAAIVELSGTGTIPVQQTISLNSGWTGISSYLLPQNSNIQNVVAGIEDELLIIKNLDEFYQPGNPTSSLQNWDYQSGYFIKVTDETTLTILGTSPGNKTISLSAGWNLIPVLSECEVSINALFAGQIDNLEFMKDAIGFNVYWPSKTLSTLTQLTPGHSYLVKVTQNIQVTFPDCE